MFAQESVMNIQKEREAFEKEMLDSGYVAGNISAFWDEKNQNYDIAITELRMAWHAWKSAKAQAVHEGFVLVPMVPSERMIKAVRQCYEGEAYLPYSLYSEFVNQAIIERMEAQEPVND